MKCLICKDDPNAKKIEKDWNEDMDERKHKIELSHGP